LPARDRNKWVVLEIAPDQIQAEMLRDLLIESGVPSIMGQGDTSSFLGVSLQPVRVMVFEQDVERAKQVLDELTPED
jgi:hypothetical protein